MCYCGQSLLERHERRGVEVLLVFVQHAEALPSYCMSEDFLAGLGFLPFNPGCLACCPPGLVSQACGTGHSVLTDSVSELGGSHGRSHPEETFIRSGDA